MRRRILYVSLSGLILSAPFVWLIDSHSVEAAAVIGDGATTILVIMIMSVFIVSVLVMFGVLFLASCDQIEVLWGWRDRDEGSKD